MPQLSIVRADSREEAETIAADEPYREAGWRTNTVRAWQLNEGVLVAAARDVATSTQTPAVLRPRQHGEPR
ncbi:MAG TPA: hypothetical protein VKI00_18115 [Mycobacterium sp.]|uniref:hypothetical protein n=1 Tax=Mycobacterium sp. TaxID=1785 RepID=UPI002BF5DE99|nr:hypothetical protein [Mycobacterium sp.]HME77486.1 hypothetical protein [Mycobacterium sp.]